MQAAPLVAAGGEPLFHQHQLGKGFVGFEVYGLKTERPDPCLIVRHLGEPPLGGPAGINIDDGHIGQLLLTGPLDQGDGVTAVVTAEYVHRIGWVVVVVFNHILKTVAIK